MNPYWELCWELNFEVGSATSTTVYGLQITKEAIPLHTNHVKFKKSRMFWSIRSFSKHSVLNINHNPWITTIASQPHSYSCFFEFFSRHDRIFSCQCVRKDIQLLKSYQKRFSGKSRVLKDKHHHPTMDRLRSGRAIDLLICLLLDTGSRQSCLPANLVLS